MRWNSFTGSLFFAAAAAFACTLYAIVLGPWLGANITTGTFVVLVASIYLLGLGTVWRTSLISSAVTAGAAMLTLVVTGSALATAWVAASSIALCRSGLLYRVPIARAMIKEVTLVVIGLGFASFLASTHVLPNVLAIWGFFLVQSVFFLLGAPRERISLETEGDGFDVARDRALAILEGR